jgi:hypothetical protein
VQVTGQLIRIDHGQTGGEQCGANPSTLGIWMNPQGLQVPDRSVRKRPLERAPDRANRGNAPGAPTAARARAGAMRALRSGLSGNRPGGCHNATPARRSSWNAPTALPYRAASRAAAV